MFCLKLLKSMAMKIIIFIILVLCVLTIYRSSDEEVTLPYDSANADTQDILPAKQVEFWITSNEDNENEELLQQLVNLFNSQHELIKVNLELKSEEYFYKIFSTAIASQTNPDVSILHNAQAVQFWDRGFLFSLDSVINNIEDEGYVFYPQALEQTMLYKQYFGIPISIENYILLLRRDIFESHHIKIPENLSELLRALRLLEQKGEAGIALPTKGILASRSLLYFIQVNGGTLFKDDGRIQLESDKNNEVYEFLHTLSSEGLIYDGESQLNINDITNLIINEEAAVVLTSPTILRDIYNKTDKDFIKNLDILSLRGFDDVFYSSGPAFSDILCVYKNSQRKEEAKVFVEWLCKNYSTLWAKNQGGDIPSIITDNEAAILNEEFSRKVFGKIISKTSFPSYPHPNSINYIVIEGTSVFNDFIFDLYEQVNLDEMLAAYQNEIDGWSLRFNR